MDKETAVFQKFSSTDEMLEFLRSKGYRFTIELSMQFRPNPAPPEGAKLAKALIVDTETTGPDTATDKLIEFGAILVEYDPKTFLIHQIIDTFNELEDPGMPISPDATKTNGITNEMVAGKVIDDARVESLVKQAAIVTCHNSNFDRKILEKRWPIFETKPFSCSLKQIDWVGEGFGSSKLDYLLYKLGFHYDAHRAVVDCNALLALLNADLPVSGKKAMQAMLEEARQKEYDLAALNSSFDSKDVLKKNGYYWDGDAKYWHKPVKEADLKGEAEWLKTNVYGGRDYRVSVTEIDAYTRFSVRNKEPKVINGSEL